MTTLYHFAAPVKSPRTFGKGILPPRGAKPYTAADEAWLIQDNARREEDARFDAMAAESVALDRLERGLCC